MQIIFFFTFYFVILSADAQFASQPFIDSLVKEIPRTKNDTAKARLYKTIAEQYSNTVPGEAMQYAEIGMKHTAAMKWNKGIAVFYVLKGNLYSDKGESAKAIDLFNKAYHIHSANKDYSNAASALNNIGTAYFRQSALDKATVKYFEALKLAESTDNNTLIATCLSNIAEVYYSQNDIPKSMEYQNKSLVIRKNENDIDGTADCYAAIGNIYLIKKDTLNARKYYADALSFYKQTKNNLGTATVNGNLSILYTDYSISLDYKLNAQKVWNSFHPAHITSITNLGNIALVYLDIVRYDTLHKTKPSPIIPATRNGLLQKAEGYLNHAFRLNSETGDMGNFTFLTGVRAELEAEKGNFKKAYFDIKTYHELYDSIYSQENKNKIAAIEGLREVAIRDKEIELNKLALSAQKNQRIGLIAGIVLLFIIGTLLYWQSRLRKKTNIALIQLNNELDNANKVKAKFFGIISHDLRGPVANLVNLLHLQNNEPGLLSSELTALHQQKITQAAGSLLDTMETMLLWSKGQMEQFKPQTKEVPVSELFSHIQNFFSFTENITFSFSAPEGLTVVSDENYLQTIMHNLTANAAKALKEIPGAAIEWKAWKDGSTTYLSVTDNGHGIQSEMTKALFDDSAVTSTKSGLGLHIVRDLARAINCKISLTNTGNGTTALLQI